MQENSDIRIEIADTDVKYKGLRALWCEVFGDSEAYVDSFYALFGDDIKGYVAVNAEGEVLSALSCYRSGEFEGRDVYVSYAVCTREDSRSFGLASFLCNHVKDLVIARGGLSLVSPAEASLEAFYEKIGYKRCFFSSEKAVLSPEFDSEEMIDDDGLDLDFGDEEFKPAIPAFDMECIGRELYNRYRESFLAETPHISLSPAMLSLAESESEGGRGLYVLNRGDAICAVNGSSGGRLVLAELIVNPLLREYSYDIDSEIASLIASHCSAYEAQYRTPGMGSCQSMIAGECGDGPAYFGFPID